MTTSRATTFHRGETPPAEGGKLFFHTPEGRQPTHIHVREAGRANQRLALVFRDYLRAAPASAAA